MAQGSSIVAQVVVVIISLAILGVSIGVLITVLDIKTNSGSKDSSGGGGTTLAPTLAPPSNTTSASTVSTTSGPTTTSRTTKGSTTTTTKAAPPPPIVLPPAKPITKEDARYSTFLSYSNLLKSWMDPKKDACNDFYAFTCGTMTPEMSFDLSDEQNNQVLRTMLKNNDYFNSASRPVKQLKYFYDKCVSNDVDPDQVLQSSVDTINDIRRGSGASFPILFQDETVPATLSPSDMAKLLGYQMGVIAGTDSAITLVVDTDWKDPHNKNGGSALFVDQPSTFLDASHYDKLGADADSGLVKTLTELVQNAAALYKFTTFNTDTLATDVAAVVALDRLIAKSYSSDEYTRRNYDRSYNPGTLENVQRLAPFVDWVSFMQQALVAIQTDFPVTRDTRVVTMEVDKLKSLSTSITAGTINPATFNNWVFLHSLSNLPLTRNDTQMVSETGLDFMKIIRRRPKIGRRIRKEPDLDSNPLRLLSLTQDELELKCADLVNVLPSAANRIFADGAYPKKEDKDSVKKRTDAMVRSILNGFRSQIDTLNWMSPSSKNGAYAKIDNLVVNIAYSDWVLDNGKLEDYYQRLDLKSYDSYTTMNDKINAFNVYDGYRNLFSGGPADRTDFLGISSTTNAWYQPELNSITFPAGILHAPFFDPSYPAAVNYGAIGIVAGHELTHGFDDEGVQWDGTGVLNGWMDANSTVSFNKMAQCVVDEYSTFCPLGDDKPCVDGAQTQGENIADNGGIQAAYKAFKSFEALNGPDPLLPGDASVFTNDQLFYISFAQVWCEKTPPEDAMMKQLLTNVHSPSKERVFGTIQNFPGFRAAFNCPAGSAYAPVNHCDVWTSEPGDGYPLGNDGAPAVADNDVHVAAPEIIKPSDSKKFSAYQTSLQLFNASTNFDIDPCNDFYGYACAKYPGPLNTGYDLNTNNAMIIRAQLEDPTYADTITQSTALTKLNQLYKACIKETLTPTISTGNYVQPIVLKLRNLLAVDVPLFGGTGASTIGATNLADALGYLSFERGLDTFLTPMVDTYWTDPVGRGYMLHVDQLTAQYDRPYYDDGAWAITKPKYAFAAKTVLQAYGGTEGAPLADDADKQIDDMLEFEKMLVLTYTGTDDDRRNYQRQWNNLEQNALPAGFDWTRYFSHGPADLTAYTNAINFNELTKLNAMLPALKLAENGDRVVNYLFTRLLINMAELIDCGASDCGSVIAPNLFVQPIQPMSQRRKRGFMRKVSFTRSRSPLSDDLDDIKLDCASATSAIADAQGRVYIDARFPTADDRDRVRSVMGAVIQNIIDAMKGMIIQLNWMDDDSKTNALKKANYIQQNVAFPDFILDNAQLDGSYADLMFINNENYYSMMNKILAHDITTSYHQLTFNTSKRDDFLGQTSIVNAWYQPELNSITFPAGILQDPYFNVDYPAGLNYGAIAIVAGHELTHGFDDEGVQWDFDGKLNSWMNPKSQPGFDAMAQCVIHQYDQYCPLPANYTPHCTSGERTQGENIADNGGIHAAWRAYQGHVELLGPDPLFADRVFSQYAENQLFFMNFGQVWCMSPGELTNDFMYKRLLTDPHSLGPYRVQGSLQNLPAFRAAFNCPLDSVYAPSKHCNVWVTDRMQ